MILALLLAVPLMAGEEVRPPANAFQTQRLDMFEKAINSLQSGRPVVTGTPEYRNGIKLGDGTTLNAAPMLLTTDQTAAGVKTFSGGITLPSGSVFTGGWTEINYSSGTGFVYPLFNFTNLVATTSYLLKAEVTIATGSTTGDLLYCRFNNSAVSRYNYSNMGNNDQGTAIAQDTRGVPTAVAFLYTPSGTMYTGNSARGDMAFEALQSSTTVISFQGTTSGFYNNAAGYQSTLGGIFRGLGGTDTLSSILCWMPGIGAGPAWRARLFKYTSALGE